MAIQIIIDNLQMIVAFDLYKNIQLMILDTFNKLGTLSTFK